MTRFLTRLFFIASAFLGLTSPALAQQPVPPEHYTLDARGVDLVQGSFNYGTTEVTIGGLSYGRVFLGAGAGWRDTNAGTLVDANDPYVSTMIASVGPVSEAFIYDGTDWVSKTSNGSTYDSTSMPGYIIITDRHGVKVYFTYAYYGTATDYAGTLEGVAESIAYPNGLVVSYHYDTQMNCSLCAGVTRLQGISDNRGYVLKYTYASNTAFNNQTNWLKLTQVTGINTAVDYCDPAANSCSGFSRTWPSVTYSSQVPPLTATDQASRVTTYAYTTGGYLDTVKYPGSSTPDIDVNYNGSDQVSAVTDASGAWSYSYADVSTTRTTSVTGPLSQALTVVSDMTIGRATSVTDAASNTWSYQYDGDLRLDRVTQPEGNYAEFDYDGRSNMIRVTQVPKSGSGLSNIVTETNYPSACTSPYTLVNCNLPTSSEDALGNITSYHFSDVHGGLESVTHPAVGGVSPQTRYSYTSLYAYYKNSVGSIVAAPTAITLPTVIEACITAAPPPSPGGCNGTAGELETSIDYGAISVANNLMPTFVTRGAGDGSLNAMTAMTYTPDGDLQTVDGPMSGSGDKTEFRYNTARQVIGVVGPDPDGSGALLNRARRMTYDTRGNVTLIEAGTTPGYTNSDWSNFATLQQQAVVYDNFSRPVQAKQQSSGGTTYSLVQTSYDAAGRTECVTVRMNPAEFGSLPSCSTTASKSCLVCPTPIASMATAAMAANSSAISWGSVISASSSSASALIKVNILTRPPSEPRAECAAIPVTE